MVVAQLVEWSLSIPEVRSSNPVIGKILYWTFTVNCIEKTKIKEKRPGLAHFLKRLNRDNFNILVWNKLGIENMEKYYRCSFYKFDLLTVFYLMTGIEPRVALVFDHPSSRRRQLQPEMMGRPELKPTTTLFQLPITILIFQLKIGDICISLTHRSQASTSSDDAKTSLQSTSANDAGEMRPPPVPPSDRERQRSRSSSPLTSSKPAASSAKSTRLSPLKQVAFSDKVVLHSPTSTKNGSKSRFEDSKSDAKDDRDVKTTKSDVDESGVDKINNDAAAVVVIKSEVDGEI